MADITMCKGEHCPKKSECYRYKAKANPYRQAYFADIPYSHVSDSCEYEVTSSDES